jgi:hypothetical protein
LSAKFVQHEIGLGAEATAAIVGGLYISEIRVTNNRKLCRARSFSADRRLATDRRIATKTREARNVFVDFCVLCGHVFSLGCGFAALGNPWLSNF